MKIKINYLFTVIFLFLVASQANGNNWFQETPLKNVYVALVDKKPMKAWQQLLLILKKPLTSEIHQQWPLVFDVLLQETRCGQDIPVKIDNNFANFIRVVLIKHYNLQQVEYHVKLSFEGVDAPFTVKLTDSNGRRLINNKTAKQSEAHGYAEVESDYFPHTYSAGVYDLVLSRGKHRWHVTLILPPIPDQDWIKIKTQASVKPQIDYSIPSQIAACPPSKVKQQVLDHRFDLLWQKVLLTNQPLIWSYDITNAHRANLVVNKSFYQGDILIEWAQGVGLPIGLVKY
ncbi:DUF2861 family protein [Endozoicomonas sp. SM1973]|uniref:DUF2861 family protein n=1 Tax=Spartinivicinus marinus TaxID=2994442 RepID=A0A853I6V2_9GAMM|nr:DUF2861 family protein [Spartinivicinus marinus]MCX4028484.1 DUF2861 family protein [Spartinivicinus marinus]NYZ67402.1 DUF2861 family protein [Spartinivicinus marinus]